MATVLPASTGAVSMPRVSQRQTIGRPGPRSTPNSNRSHAPASFREQRPRQQYRDDSSSEDELPMPVKLSTFKPLLNDDPLDSYARPEPLPYTKRRTSQVVASSHSAKAYARPESAQSSDAGKHSPMAPANEANPPRKRVVRLSSTPQSLNKIKLSRQRSTSVSRGAAGRPPSRTAARDREREGLADHEQSVVDARPNPALDNAQSCDANTPSHKTRVVRIVLGSSGSKSRSRLDSSGPSSAYSHMDRSSVDPSGLEADLDASEAHDAGVRNLSNHGNNAGPFSSGPSRNDENASLQGSMGIKRVGKISGSFLSGPARRGRRRQSEEDAEVNGKISGEADNAMPAHESDDYRLVEDKAADRRPEMPSSHDQENEIPINLKYAKRPGDHVLDKRPRHPSHVEIIRPASPERKPLAPMTNNTPLRPAPPPPSKKKPIAEAPASTSQAKQRRTVVKVNGKCYTRHNCLGRGGSARVYRVTDDNGAWFALKRVSLENADELNIRGYKGEIDLLRKLSQVDRVIKLYDDEINAEKQVLSLIMEMGELDLNKMMTPSQDPTSTQYREKRRFDSADVRFWWKEMLQCVQSVHQYDVVHSDLKPANFVLVQGRLKIIDFGIANAIQTDETVNVHRENQIGTPNYMSPESLIDSNNPRGSGTLGRQAKQPKLMKLGKPSDVWSLGCILYQMVYGSPPFGHIPNQMARCQAIIDWDHEIQFASRGMGGVPVPPELLRTMQRCLNREQHMRPTCEELLQDTDPFLYPVGLSDKVLPMNEELLASIIQSVVAKCRERMPSESEVLSVWPQAYWARIQKAITEQRGP
ncbi:hypothetical protein CDD82_2819 [Ophiocordyceps australis]|uniref:Protein kinase domain-containing protein n=1 Tax=Ophiocordyceps australis TaxID=1399860 RepID=A0A2C5ZGC7_9HYPO|nr:hypothetical protein CDD82_2819 [Ophiocordyceps australis]